MLTSRLFVDKFAFRTICERRRAQSKSCNAAGIMNLRLAVSVVFVGSLAYACGPTTRTDASRDISFSQQGIALASMGGTSAHEKNTVEKKLKSNTTSLSASFDVAQNS